MCAVTVDFSKTLNGQNHKILIELLSDLDVPGWLLNIVIGFLENRELEVNYKGETSDRKKLPGGGPQGTLLGMFLFLVLINAAGFRENLKNVGSILTKKSNKKKPMLRIHLKYIDDMTVAESLNLKKQLVKKPDPNPPRPLQFHDRTGHILPQGVSVVQKQLEALKTYSDDHQMRLNVEKTKVIVFNRSKKYDFMPNCYFNPGENLKVVEELKLTACTNMWIINYMTLLQST